ncbi:hypothetical protein [uncultured Alsobacter sp.]|uniref:hypothetical protein n=1 Tax=uncultured Alsobacter sp. TaxID=1748258 RepID=UPI0025EAB75C|nr:hypothetical protein [uncultured Alsobacter sp.]
MNDNIQIDLDHQSYAHLQRLSDETGRSVEELAASLLAEVLHDDAEAHQPPPQPMKVFMENGQQMQLPEIRVTITPGSPPPNEGTSASRPKLSEAGLAAKLPKLRKTAAEIRHEARTRDPILVEKEARLLQEKVPLPAKRGPGRPSGAKTDKPAPPAPAGIVPKVTTPTTDWTAGEDSTLKLLRSLGNGPYDIAKTLKRDVNDVRKRISELWVKK